MHKCHAYGCKTKCKPEFLMCPRHWRMVSKKLQLEVYRHYVDGQCNLNPPPTKEWLIAAKNAISAVKKKEY